jgi:hypothetical protein
MDEVREERILRITEQFIAEQEAGQQPRLTDYVRRYPQYAMEIAGFVAYYTALEASALSATATVPELSTDAQAALERGWKRVAAPSALIAVSLQTLAWRHQYSLAQLATRLDLSSDLVDQLARRQLVAATVPHELLQRLAQVLAQSLEVVRQTLGTLERSGVPTLGEERVVYDLSSAAGSDVPRPATFREAILSSSRLSAAQKERWLAILEHEGL